MDAPAATPAGSTTRPGQRSKSVGENRDRHAQSALVVVDVFDHALEGAERPVGDPDTIAGNERDRHPRMLDTLLDLRLDPLGLGIRDR